MRTGATHVLAFAFGLLAGRPALAQQYSFASSAADYGYFYPTAYMDQGGRDWN